MKKKFYIIPKTKVLVLKTQQLLLDTSPSIVYDPDSFDETDSTK